MSLFTRRHYQNASVAIVNLNDHFGRLVFFYFSWWCCFARPKTILFLMLKTMLLSQLDCLFGAWHLSKITIHRIRQSMALVCWCPCAVVSVCALTRAASRGNGHGQPLIIRISDILFDLKIFIFIFDIFGWSFSQPMSGRSVDRSIGPRYMLMHFSRIRTR